MLPRAVVAMVLAGLVLGMTATYAQPVVGPAHAAVLSQAGASCAPKYSSKSPKRWLLRSKRAVSDSDDEVETDTGEDWHRIAGLAIGSGLILPALGLLAYPHIAPVMSVEGVRHVTILRVSIREL